MREMKVCFCILFKIYSSFYVKIVIFIFTGESSVKKKMKMEEDDREKLERSSSNVDAILEDVIKGFEDKGRI